MENEEMTNDAAVAIQRYDYTDPAYADYSYFGKVEGGEFVRYSDHATTVAELRAEVERLTEQLRYVADACEHETARADAAERRVAELEAFVTAVRTECFDYWNEGIRPWPHHMQTLAWKAEEALKPAALTKESP